MHVLMVFLPTPLLGYNITLRRWHIVLKAKTEGREGSPLPEYNTTEGMIPSSTSNVWIRESDLFFFSFNQINDQCKGCLTLPSPDSDAVQGGSNASQQLKEPP